MSGRRGITVLGVAVAGGAGYYLYNAGGDPKVAEKKFEADMSKASAKVKSEAPGREKEYQKKGEAMAKSAGQEFDQTVASAQTKLDEAKKTALDYKESAAKEIKKEIDQFDKTVEKKTAEAKTGISSWFGGK